MASHLCCNKGDGRTDPDSLRYKTAAAMVYAGTPTPHNPDSRQNRHKHGGATPDQGRYTRSEKVHCLRIGRTAPTHKNKRGADRTSPLPTTTSPSIGHQADLLSPIDAAPPRASSWACAQVVDGLFMRLLSRPLGVFRFR